MQSEGQGWWRVFVAMASFVVIGFLISQSSRPQWGVLFGAFGFACYITGYAIGLTFGREQR
jgi:hydrogenase/urease accessory protein HupE